MNNKNFNKKIKTTMLALIFGLSTNLGIVNNAYAINYSNIDLNNKFIVEISRGNPDSYTSNENNDYVGYLVYSPTDVNFTGYHSGNGKLDGGKLYYIYYHTTMSGNSNISFTDDGLYMPNSGNSNSSITITTLGNAGDILGGGMSEDELKQAIDDAIHNVQGDQTVNGSQDITGDQTVEGEQTVNGGQTVTGGFYFF